MAKKEMIPVGQVEGLFRFPVKSFSGEAIESSWIGWHGLEADRRYAFLKLNSKRGFPWLTARDIPQLLDFHAYLIQPDEPKDSPVHVLTPDGADFPVRSEVILEYIAVLSRGPVHLLQDWGGVFDAMDISLISTQSITSVSEMVGYPLEVARFRPNILVNADAARAYPENKWQKSLLVFGDHGNAARIRVNRRTLRCMVINVNPTTSRQQPEILKSVVKERNNYVGVYASTERPGYVSVGDTIYLVKD